ncbi:RNase adapter RapZ [Halomonas litopenaei]|uniref:RNase adapter RapZ n=1 Tax=Halomonas litopenaei TaxID=2109328 RepID=UPI001A9016FB|nr:RNase adapter RapZ [Halomonas litopenaei]MBN8410771.1 RNase adapter RapZ [Halomonas litopenaei]MED5296737.1 RNase adapter RapZ [Pseudomonadota bacterium]
MQLVIISGRSGSGKSVALQALEDLGFYAIDNLPATLLGSLVEELENGHSQRIAVSVDARNLPEALERFPAQLTALKQGPIDCQVVYLTSDARILLERYSHTRRRHPLTRNTDMTLAEAIESEQKALSGIRDLADLIIDSSRLSVHELRSRIAEQVADHRSGQLSLTIESFGFKRGVPPDADIVFDARCLPNPYWEPSLRDANGCDQSVITFLEHYQDVADMKRDILTWVRNWLPRYQASQRSYLTVAVGCTGGQHRSVYLAESIAAALVDDHPRIRLRHRELGQQRRLDSGAQ